MKDSAVWLTCRDCGDTTRVLALMASRVLKMRTHCPACRSTCEPCLNQTPAGTSITLSVEQRDVLREMDDKSLREWLENEAYQPYPHRTALQWIQAAGSRLADRFANGGVPHRQFPAAGLRAYSSRNKGPLHDDVPFHGTGTIGETGSAAIRL